MRKRTQAAEKKRRSFGVILQKCFSGNRWVFFTRGEIRGTNNQTYDMLSEEKRFDLYKPTLK